VRVSSEEITCRELRNHYTGGTGLKSIRNAYLKIFQSKYYTEFPGQNFLLEKLMELELPQGVLAYCCNTFTNKYNSQLHFSIRGVSVISINCHSIQYLVHYIGKQYHDRNLSPIISCCTHFRSC
jgi:hypothetical protein